MEIGKAPWRAWGTSLTAGLHSLQWLPGRLDSQSPAPHQALRTGQRPRVRTYLVFQWPWAGPCSQASSPVPPVQFYLFASFSWKCCSLTVLLKCTSPGKFKLWTVLDNAEHISFSWQRQVKRFLGYDAKCCDMTLVSLWPRSGQGCDVNDTPSPTHGLWWLEADAGTSPPPRVPSHLCLWGWQQVGIADKWLISSPIKWLQSSFLWSLTDYILHPPLFWQLHSSSALC